MRYFHPFHSTKAELCVQVQHCGYTVAWREEGEDGDWGFWNLEEEDKTKGWYGVPRKTFDAVEEAKLKAFEDLLDKIFTALWGDGIPCSYW